jgi:DNA-binding response OmpR family regulator
MHHEAGVASDRYVYSVKRSEGTAQCRDWRVSTKIGDSEVSLKKGAHRRSRVVLGGIRRQYVAMGTVAPGPELGLRALVVDDEIPLAEVVAGYLKREMFEVHLAHDGHRALDLAREVDPHVVVLDIGLPGVDGVEVCRQLRVFSDAYVVMLTARDTEMDTIVGLSVGADDYVTKPFSPRELVARVRAMMRRPRRPSLGQADPGSGMISPPRQFGELLINVDGREVHVEGTSVSLTRTEFDILEALSARPGVVLSRNQLLASVWGESWVSADNIVDVHVGHLRRKLGDNPTTPRYVTTVRGVGYRMGAG